MDDKQDIVDEKRERTLTEKGLEYTLTLKQAERSRLIKVLTVTSNDLQTLMQRSTDPNEVKPTYSKWLSEYEELLNIHDQYFVHFQDKNKLAANTVSKFCKVGMKGGKFRQPLENEETPNRDRTFRFATDNCIICIFLLVLLLRCQNQSPKQK